MRVRQRREDNGLDDGEDRRVRADPERENQQRRQRKRRPLPQHARGILRVLPDECHWASPWNCITWAVRPLVPPESGRGGCEIGEFTGQSGKPAAKPLPSNAILEG